MSERKRKKFESPAGFLKESMRQLAIDGDDDVQVKEIDFR